MARYTSFPVKITLASPPPHAPSPPGLRAHFPFAARSTSTQALARLTACSHHRCTQGEELARGWEQGTGASWQGPGWHSREGSWASGGI